MISRGRLARWAQSLLVPLVMAAAIALVVSDIMLDVAATGGTEPGKPHPAEVDTPPDHTEPGCTRMPNGIIVCHPEAAD